MNYSTIVWNKIMQMALNNDIDLFDALVWFPWSHEWGFDSLLHLLFYWWKSKVAPIPHVRSPSCTECTYFRKSCPLEQLGGFSPTLQYEVDMSSRLVGTLLICAAGLLVFPAIFNSNWNTNSKFHPKCLLFKLQKKFYLQSHADSCDSVQLSFNPRTDLISFLSKLTSQHFVVYNILRLIAICMFKLPTWFWI